MWQAAASRTLMDLHVDDLIEALLGGEEAKRAATHELVTRAGARSTDVVAGLHRRLLFRGGLPPLAALLGELVGEAGEAAVVDALVLMLRDHDPRTREAAAATIKRLTRERRVAARLAHWAAEPQGWPADVRQQVWAHLADSGSWPETSGDVRLLAEVAARERDPDAPAARRRLWRAVRDGDFAAAAMESLGTGPGGREVLLRMAVELEGAAAEAARDRLLSLAGVEADPARWAEIIDVPAELGRLTAGDAAGRCDAATVLGTFRAAAARPALERALHDPIPAVREAAARALARLGSREASAALADVVRASRGKAVASDEEEAALAAAFDALGAVGDLDSLKVFLTLTDERSVRRARGPTAALARRLGAPAGALARAMLAGTDPPPPLALRAFGAAGGAEALPVLASLLERAHEDTLAALGATRAAAAVPEILGVVRETTYSGFGAAGILQAASTALAEVLAHDARLASDGSLVAVAELADTVVVAGSGGMSTRVPVLYADAREHAETELLRRGLPCPAPRGLRRIRIAPRGEASTPPPEPRPARLRGVDGCPDCGDRLVVDGRRPGAYGVICSQGHRREVRTEYAALAFDPPRPDVPFTAHFERCTGAPLPFEVPQRSGPLALERRTDGWIETQVGTPEADVAFPELERGNFAAAPWRSRPARHGVFLAGFAAIGRTTAFRVLDVGPDRMIFLSSPFGGVDAQEGDLARQAPDVVRLGRVHARLVAELGDRVAYIHAIQNGDRGYCGLTLSDGRVIHHEGRLLVDDVKDLWTPRLAPARCPRCQADAPAKEVPKGSVYMTAPVEVAYQCAACRHAFRAPWPGRTAPSPRPPPR